MAEVVLYTHTRTEIKDGWRISRKYRIYIYEFLLLACPYSNKAPMVPIERETILRKLNNHSTLFDFYMRISKQQAKFGFFIISSQKIRGVITFFVGFNWNPFSKMRVPSSKYVNRVFRTFNLRQSTCVCVHEYVLKFRVYYITLATNNYPSRSFPIVSRSYPCMCAREHCMRLCVHSSLAMDERRLKENWIFFLLVCQKCIGSISQWEFDAFTTSNDANYIIEKKGRRNQSHQIPKTLCAKLVDDLEFGREKKKRQFFVLIFKRNFFCWSSFTCAGHGVER